MVLDMKSMYQAAIAREMRIPWGCVSTSSSNLCNMYNMFAGQSGASIFAIGIIMSLHIPW